MVIKNIKFAKIVADGGFNNFAKLIKLSFS